MSSAESPDAAAHGAAETIHEDELGEVAEQISALDEQMVTLVSELRELQEIENLSEEEQAQFDELLAKQTRYSAARTELERLVGILEDQEAQHAYKNAPKDWVYIRHVGRKTVNHAVRAARAGNRRQGVVLDNGLRIRKQGHRRLTKLNLKEFVAYHERLLFYFDNYIIEILDPATMKAISRQDLVSGLKRMAKKYGKKIVVGPEKAPYSLVSGMKAGAQPPPDRTEDATRPDIDAAAMTAAVDQANAKKAGEANPPPSEMLEEDPVEEDLTEADLKKMSRAELDDVATENGLNPVDYSSKDKLIAALLGEEE